NLIRLSRESQYSLLLDASPAFIPEIPEQAVEKSPVVFYQGQKGAYSNVASIKMYPGSEYKNVRNFEDIFAEVSETAGSCGVLPLENSMAGIVGEVYDYLLKYRLYINKSFMLPINHALLALPGTPLSEIKRVLSHPHALSQCSGLLRRIGAEAVPVSNTAVAAGMVYELKRPDTAAIASLDTARIYGLDAIEKDIANGSSNFTRFISVSSALIKKAADDKVVIAFALPHLSGSLAEVLSVFADYKINLSHIQSRPRPGTPFEYYFYVDFDGNLGFNATRAVLLQLKKELPFLRILGTYSGGGL
ncbi:MAG: prephenate dehydratase domain-containing protein, partial [Bacillota bacterium]|nr:prephenate dehydratase domain-containing protein [Bacillota bacterium]